MRDTVERDTVSADSPSASVTTPSTSRVDSPRHEPRDHQRLQGVGLGHSRAEELGGEPFGGVA